jgi:hypothetical protein
MGGVSGMEWESWCDVMWCIGWNDAYPTDANESKTFPLQVRPG